MEHYKSWAGLRSQLQGFLCESLRDRVSYFLTRYHDVHNAYGRAAIQLDGKELVIFSWIEMYRQEEDLHQSWKETGVWDENHLKWKEKWDRDCTYYEMDFLDAALRYRNLPVKEALESDDFLLKIFAIMDKRIGKRTLRTIAELEEYKEYPAWVRQFYGLRLQDVIT